MQRISACATQFASHNLGANMSRSYSNRILKRMRGCPKKGEQQYKFVDIAPPKYPVQPVNALPSGWAPPNPSDVTSALPFSVSRTPKGNQIPVYTEFKNGRTRELTIVRRISGDVKALAAEIGRVTGGAHVNVTLGGLEIEGNRSKEIKYWLMSLGF